MNENIFQFKWRHLFLVYIVIYIAIIWLTKSLIFNDTYYYMTLGNKLSGERIGEIIAMNKKVRWISFAIMPIFLFLKLGIISGIIYVGVILSNEEIIYMNCFRITMITEIPMIIGSLARIIWIILFSNKRTREIQFFYPLSITNFLGTKQVPAYLIYPLQQINVFEVAYWILIAAGIQTFTQKSFWQSLKITASSYGVAMLVWVLFIVFIQLQFS